ncbi:hypothetical protein J4E85_009818 [Alternaria conjuncta]|uniref:uncharacterized protein n=1 Tax=Alternaria conjuncta TaxID=181017 RepID=UPI00221F669A|nr:uncharacterized protein J4E85_009818 [Alternaria conjuncta]KAI4917726.1 hypothetical protein J4E85_009818 [Alternaria conjuncta]
MSTQDITKPFRFMDLPTELRLMIYKRLPRQIKHTEFRYVGSLFENTVDSTVILVTRHLPVAIMRTSRQVHDEAYTIVTSLIQKFVTESQPRVIGHDTHLYALLVLKWLIPNEREAYLAGQAYRVSDVVQRLDLQPWSSERSRAIAMFMGQATLATKAGTRGWNGIIATVRFADLNDPALGSRLYPHSRSNQGVPIFTSSEASLRSPPPGSFEGKTMPHIERDFMLVHALNGEIKVTPENVPQRPDCPKFFKTGEWKLENCMSQEVWAGEWLPSS